MRRNPKLIDSEEFKTTALIVLGCIAGALLVLLYHAVKRVFT